MQKNVAGQKVGGQMVSATDGSAFTDSVTVYVTGDAGTQAAGSVGSGACTHEGNGYHTYAPAQAETNYDLVAFTFIGTGAVPSTVQVFTGFPQTGDSFARLGAAGAGLTAIPTVAAVTTVGSVTGAVGSVTGNVGGNVTGSVGSVTGAVGSVTAPVTAGTVSDKTGYALSSAGVQAIWDALTSALTTVGSVGKRIADNLDATISSRGTSTYAGGDTAGTTTLLGRIIGTLATGTHNPQGGDAYARLGAAGAGLTALGDTRLANLDATVSSRLAPAGTLATVTNLTNLPAAAALEATLTAMKGATFSGATDSLEAIRDRGDAAWVTADVSDLPTNSELATALASADDAMLTAIADVPTVAEFEARTLVAASYATAANLATLSGYVDTEVAAILADTNELQTDLTNGGRLDLLIDAIKAKTDNLPTDPADQSAVEAAITSATSGLATAANLATLAGYVDTEVAAILADTNELQTDWANGGRLDLILDARSSQTSVDDLPTNSELATALSGITASVDQQDIANALLLAPSGVAASGSAMDVLADILEDTGTTIPAAIAGIGGLAGSGAISFPVTINDEDSNPIDGVEVWVTTDSAGTNVVAGTLSTDALGLATFMLDAGTYYVWRQKSGYNFANPVTITVS